MQQWLVGGRIGKCIRAPLDRAQKTTWLAMSNRYRERKFNSSDNDRLARALPQPVQAWQVNERQKRDQKKCLLKQN